MKENVIYRDLRKIYPKIVKGKGICLYDEKGKKYIDGSSGALVVNIGHGVEEVISAMTAQANKVCFVSRLQFTSDVQIKLASKIASLAPDGLSMVSFASGGSEANEVALKMARQFHIETGNCSKFKVISRWQSYHGNTVGSLSMTGHPKWRKNFTPYILNFPHISPPYCYRCPFGKNYPNCDIDCAGELERVIKQEGSETISAFISEPIVGDSGGAIIPPPEYFKIIRSTCDRYNVIMISDEVITGLGRTGKNFGINHWDVVPDIITMGKGISSGYTPLSGIIVHQNIYDLFMRSIKENSPSMDAFLYGATFSGNPLSCSVGLAVLEYIEKNNLVKRSENMGLYLLQKLNRLKQIETVGDIRGKGLLVGIEFVSDKGKRTPFEREKHFSKKIGDAAFEMGLICYPGYGGIDGTLGDHIIIAPPLIINESEIDEIVSILEKALVKTNNQL
jgi:adenosylmethionine-8-amino-7-oxononanoate aminotransferase